MTEEDRQFEIYKQLLENWRWQINSNWHRTDYFAAFQTALLLAAGKVILDQHLYTGLALAAFGVLLNVGWILNDMKTGAYTNYWRAAIDAVEGEISLPSRWQFVSRSEYEGKAREWGARITYPKYSHLMWGVRLLFTVAWISLITAALVLRLRH